MCNFGNPQGQSNWTQMVAINSDFFSFKKIEKISLTSFREKREKIPCAATKESNDPCERISIQIPIILAFLTSTTTTITQSLKT